MKVATQFSPLHNLVQKISLISVRSLITTNAARYRIAAGINKIKLLEFGLRRAQGPDGGLSASKYAYIGKLIYSNHLNTGHFQAGDT